MPKNGTNLRPGVFIGVFSLLGTCVPYGPNPESSIRGHPFRKEKKKNEKKELWDHGMKANLLFLLCQKIWAHTEKRRGSQLALDIANFL